MNIIVVLRPILDPAGFIVNRKAQKVFVNRENYILNPTDKNALEAALRLSDTVTAVSIGDAPAEDALRQARAIGASRAMLVRDAALKSADASVMTTVLQRLVHHLDGADLMLLGAEVVDADLAQLGPRLAMALGWPFVEGAQEIFVQGHGVHAITRPRVSVRRPAPAPPFADPPPRFRSQTRRERGGQEKARGPEESAGARQTDGFHQIEADLPAVISVARDSNKPRYAPGARLVNVYQANDVVEILTAADLGLSEADLAPLTERRGESFPPEREFGKVAEGSLDEIAGRVMDVLRKR